MAKRIAQRTWRREVRDGSSRKLLTAEDHWSERANTKEHRRLASRALRLAKMRKLLRRPSLILVMGPAGSGKTTLAREILRRITAVYLDNNHIADAFFPETRNGTKYNKLRPGFYKALYTIAEENLKLGNSVLLDVPHIKEMQRPEWRTSIQQIIKRTKAKLVVLRCLCSDKTVRDRLATRGKRRDIWKLNHWKEFLKEQPINVRIPFTHLDIDTERPSSTNSSAAVQYILEQGARGAKFRER